METLRNRSSINPAVTIGPVTEGLAPILFSQVAKLVDALSEVFHHIVAVFRMRDVQVQILS